MKKYIYFGLLFFKVYKAVIAVFALAIIALGVAVHIDNETHRAQCKQLQEQGVETHITEFGISVKCYVPKFIPVNSGR